MGLSTEGWTALALIGGLVVMAGAFLGVGFILALIAGLLAFLTAVASNGWRVISVTAQNFWYLFTWPFNNKWAFLAAVLIWWIGLSAIEFQNEEMQAVDVFYECTFYDPFSTFVSATAVPLRKVWDFVTPRWNDLVLYLRDCIDVLIMEWPNFLSPSVPTRSEIVQAISASANFVICVILAPVSIPSWEIPFFTDVLAAFLDVVVCLIQLATDFLAAVILDPANFFNGPCFVLLDKFFDCVLAWFLFITASGFNGLLDTWVEDLVDSMHCFVGWLKQVGIDIAKVQLQSTWEARGLQFCACLGDLIANVLTGGLLPQLGDFVECICGWLVSTTNLFLQDPVTAGQRFPETLQDLCGCIEDHLLPLSTAEIWQETIGFVLCLCDWFTRVLIAGRDYEVFSGDCYFCQRCPTCRVSAAGVAAGCSLRAYGNELINSNSTTVLCQVITGPPNCQGCCNNCEQYCTCDGCHDFINELVFCFCDYVQFLAYDNFLYLGPPFRGYQVLILRTGCHALVCLLNMWRPVLRALQEYGQCTFPADPISGVTEVLAEWLSVADKIISLVSDGSTCAAWSPIPIPFFLDDLPELDGPCDSFVFVIFLQIIEFIIDLVGGLGFEEVVEAILCLVGSGFTTCVQAYPNGGGAGTGSPYPSCSFAYCWDLYGDCVSDIGGIWTPVTASGFFTAISTFLTFFDFVICPVADILDCFLMNQFGTPFPNITQLASVSGQLRSLTVCIGNLQVSTSFPFRAFTDILIPFIDINTAFLTAFANNGYLTLSGTFTNLTTFITALKGITWVGQTLLTGLMTFLIEPIFKLVQCATSNFTLNPASTTALNSSLFIITALTQLNDFNLCVQTQVSFGTFPGLIFAPLMALVVRPLVRIVFCTLANLNPRPATFTAVVTRLNSICSCSAGIGFGTDGTTIFAWVWDFFQFLKDIMQCILDSVPADGNWFLNLGFLFNNLNCVSSVQYSSSGIPAAMPFYNFFQVLGNQFFLISNTFNGIFTYLVILSAFFNCFDVSGCCSDPVTETSDFIDEIVSLFSSLTCAFTFSSFSVPGFPTRDFTRDPTPEDGLRYAAYLEELRVWWNTTLETRFEIPTNSTCGKVLYNVMPSEVDYDGDWVNGVLYMACAKMLGNADLMMHEYPGEPVSKFNCPSAALFNTFDVLTKNLTSMNHTSFFSDQTQEIMRRSRDRITFDTLAEAGRPRSPAGDYSNGFASIADIEEMVQRELEGVSSYAFAAEEGAEEKREAANLFSSSSAVAAELALLNRPRNDMDPTGPPLPRFKDWREMYQHRGTGGDSEAEEQEEEEEEEKSGGALVWDAFVNSGFGDQIKEDYESITQYARDASLQENTNRTEEMVGSLWSGFARYVRRYREFRQSNPHSTMQAVDEALHDLQMMRDHVNDTSFNMTTVMEAHLEKHKETRPYLHPEKETPPSRAQLRRIERFGTDKKRTRRDIAGRLHRKIFGLREPPRTRSGGATFGPFLMPNLAAKSLDFSSLWNEYKLIKDEEEALRLLDEPQERADDGNNKKQKEWYLENRNEDGSAPRLNPELSFSRRFRGVPETPRVRTLKRDEEAIRRRLFRNRAVYPQVPPSVLSMAVSGTNHLIDYLMPSRLLAPTTPAPFNWNDKALEFLDWLWVTLFNAPDNFWSDKVVIVTFTFEIVQDLIDPIWNGILSIVNCKVPEQINGTLPYSPFCFPLLPETLFDWIQPLPTHVFQIQIPWPNALIEHNCTNTNGAVGPVNCPSDPPDNVRPLCPACDYCERTYYSCRDDLGWEDGFDNVFYFFVAVPRWFSATFANHGAIFSSDTFAQLLQTLIVFPFIFAIPGSFGVLVIPIYGPIALYIPYYTAYFWVLALWLLSFPFAFPDISQFDVANLLTSIIETLAIIIPDNWEQFFLSRIDQVAYPVTAPLPSADTFCFYFTLSNFGLTFITLVFGWYVFAIIGNAVASIFIALFALVTSIGLIVQSAMMRFMRLNVNSLEVRTETSDAMFHQMFAGGGRPALAIARATGLQLSAEDIRRINEGGRETFEVAAASHHRAPPNAPLVQQFIQQMGTQTPQQQLQQQRQQQRQQQQQQRSYRTRARQDVSSDSIV